MSKDEAGEKVKTETDHSYPTFPYRDKRFDSVSHLPLSLLNFPTLIRAAAAERLALSAAAFEDKGNSGSGADHPGIKKDNIAANSQDDYITVDGEKKIKEPTNKRIIFDGNARVDPSAALLLFRRKYRPIV